MSDNLANKGPQDRARVNTSEAHEVRYWTNALGCSAEELIAVVKRVGPMADDVRKALERK